MTQPLKVFTSKVGVIGGATQGVSHLSFTKVTSIEELDALLAKNKGKKIMVDFAAEWCTSCKEFEEITFADAGVVAKLSEFVLIQADVTANTDKEKALSKKYGVFGPPVILFFDESGKWQQGKTVVGYMEPKLFLDHLSKL